MNVKIYKNIVLDLGVFLMDALLILGSAVLGWYIISKIVPGYEFSYAMILVYFALMVFAFWCYELYTSVIRDHYELGLSVVLSNIVSVLGSIIIVSLIKWEISWLTVLNIIFMGVILSIVLYWEKRVYVKVVKSLEGQVKLLVLENSERQNDFARKIKYSALSVYDSWYIMVNDDDLLEINIIIKDMFPKYDCILISPTMCEEARTIFMSAAVNMKKDIFLIPDLYNTSIVRSVLTKFDDTPALKIKPFGLTVSQCVIKRCFDIVMASIGIIILSPVMLICAALVKIDSPGSVLYKQERLTKNKKPFYIWKFRSMVQDAEKATGAVMATYNDPRITRVGKWLRALRLDELPQLFNILKGDMSIVGPRPERPKFVEEFSYVRDYDKRYFVKAGLTGMAPVYSRYNTKPEDSAIFDLLYIRGYSFLLDLKIIMLTLKVIFIKEASEGVKEEEFQSFNRKMDSPEQRGVYGNVFEQEVEEKEKTAF